MQNSQAFPLFFDLSSLRSFSTFEGTLNPKVFVSTWFKCYNFQGSVPGLATCLCNLLLHAVPGPCLFSSVHYFELLRLKLFSGTVLRSLLDLNSWPVWRTSKISRKTIFKHRSVVS